jgi:hypothetical protein
VPPADAGAIATTEAARTTGRPTASSDLTFFVNINFLSGMFLVTSALQLNQLFELALFTKISKVLQRFWTDIADLLA